MSDSKNLIVLVGPTAVGKTDVAIHLAKCFNAEVISADSRQFFKELVIGTAKPTHEELSLVPHHFINTLSITEDYDAARYADDALTLINNRFEELDFLVVCGGSGLYTKALLEGFDYIPAIPDALRKDITQHYRDNGIGWLQEKVKEHDPAFFEAIDQRNPARLMRALEVILATGNSIATYHSSKNRELPFSVIKIGLERDREELYSRIDKRMDAMIEAGLFEEAAELYPYRHHNALQTVGYKEIFDFMEGKYDREETIRLLKRNSRRYAKRQFTWFKRDEEIIWMNPDNINLIINRINGSESVTT
jgi:tRNA dimethylallyltransferase